MDGNDLESKGSEIMGLRSRRGSNVTVRERKNFKDSLINEKSTLLPDYVRRTQSNVSINLLLNETDKESKKFARKKSSEPKETGESFQRLNEKQINDIVIKIPTNRSRQPTKHFEFTRNVKGLNVYWHVICIIGLSIMNFMVLINLCCAMISKLSINLIDFMAVSWIPINIFMIYKVVYYNSYLEPTERPSFYDCIANLPLKLSHRARKRQKIYVPLLVIYVAFIIAGLFAGKFLCVNLINTDFFEKMLSIFRNYWKLTTNFLSVLKQINSFFISFDEKYMKPIKENLNESLKGSILKIIKIFKFELDPSFVGILRG